MANLICESESAVVLAGSTGRKSRSINSTWVVRLLPSLTDIAFLLPLLCIFHQLHGPGTLLGDGDSGWHIRTGEWILANGRVPVVDMFSFTKPGQPWFAWEWGWDVSAALIQRFWGLTGVLGINIVLLCFISALLYKLVRHVCQNDVLAFVVTAAAMVGSTIHWLARPHLASWLLLVLFCHAIQRAKDGRWGLFWCLPVLQLLWTNVHGSFFVGPAMIFVGAADRLLRAGDRRTAWRFAVCGCACSLLTLANPYGWRLHTHLAAYLLDSQQLDKISEYQPISFHSSSAIFIEVFFLCGAFGLAWLGKEKRFADLLWLALWMHLALKASRNVPLFLFFAAPIIAEMIQSVAQSEWAAGAGKFFRTLGQSISTAGQDFRPLEAISRTHFLSIGGIAVLTWLLVHPPPSEEWRAEFASHRFPVGASNFLQSAGVSNVFTTDAWGGYIIYRLYPQCRVFVDGRSDFYGAPFDDLYIKTATAQYDWEANLDRFPVDAVLVAVDSPLSSVLKESHRWKPAFDDGVAIVFRRLTRRAEDSARRAG